MHPTFKQINNQSQVGFTLIELIVVIVITSILAVGAANFIATPTQLYFDTEARANLTDRADGTLRQMARGIRNALPNSVRVILGANPSTDDSLIEFIPTITAGRYRASKGDSATDNPLTFPDNDDNTFDIIGPALNIATGQQLVIYNLGELGQTAYDGSNIREISSTSTGNNRTSLTFIGASFPLSSPAKRFYVVATPITYVCDMSEKTLFMYSNYPIQAAQPASTAVLDGLGSSVRKSVLAENITNCEFNYGTGLSARSAVVNITLSMTEKGANVRLMHQVNVVNSP